MASLVAAGCGPPFDPASFVKGLRLLAVKAEPPELAPGQTTTLTPLVVDSRGADAGTPTIEWSLCNRAALPGSSVSLDCFRSDLGSDATTALGQGETLQFTMPTLTPVELGLPDFTGGVYLPVILRVTSGGETVTAVYRLRYTQTIMTPVFTGPIQPPNHNPHLEDILIAFERDAGTRPLEADFEIHKGDRVMLRAQLPDSDHEEYPQIEGSLEVPDGGISLDGGIHFFDGGLSVGGITLVNVKETLRVSWFANLGRVEPDVTGAAGKLDTTLYLDKYLADAPADIDLYTVVRDDRGGTDFTHRTLHYR